LIGSAGIMLGAVLGIHHLATLGLWALGAAAAMGAGCVIGSALVRSAGYASRETREEYDRQPCHLLVITRSLLADAGRGLGEEEQQHRQDDTVLVFEQEMSALGAVARAEQPEDAAGHIERLARHREQQARGTARGR
jgi:hypothetical protein